MATNFTINDLARFVSEELKKGNGEKKILISNDDEGNGYHCLYYGFTPTKNVFGGKYPPCLPYGVKKDEINDYIILG